MTPSAKLLAAALAAGALLAPAGAQAQVLRQRLDNGVVVLARENPAAAAVAVSVMIRVGGRWERDDNSGITNLLQHVLLKGTQSRSAFQVAEEAESAGGTIGASSDLDYSEIRGTALARHWRRLLALVADVALRPALAQSEIDNERRIVSTGLRSRLDQPFPATYDRLMTELYGRHPYGAPALGRAAVIERLDREALVAHYGRFYRSDRIIVSVSGQVPGREVVDEVSRLFAGAPRDVAGADPPPPNPASSLQRMPLVRPASQAQVLIGFLAPPMSHPDYAAVKVLQAALGGGMAGRLFVELRDRQGLAYSTAAMYPARVDQSFFLAHIGTAPANASRAEAGMRAQIERIRSERISEDELGRAKAYLLGLSAMDRRTNTRLAWYAAFYEAAGVGQDFDARYAAAVEAVTAADVLRVASRYLTTPTTVALEPTPR